MRTLTLSPAYAASRRYLEKIVLTPERRTVENVAARE